jgi:pilus assembly protein CpaE
MSTFMRDTESLSMSALSLVLIGPYEDRRRALAKAVAGPQANVARELKHYPQLDELTELIEEDFDVVIVDLDPNPEQALDVVENLCSRNNAITVMVHAGRVDSDLLVRCMRAGAREFLSEPLLPATVAEALVRASVRRDEVLRHKTATGKLLVFAGPKGGSGVTTLASNFAVALACYGKVALIDLDLHLGDAALTLGVATKFSALDAVEGLQRLDADLLSSLMAKHSSGLAVLGAPDTIPGLHPSSSDIERVLRVAREDFAYVVVDAGSHSPDLYIPLFAAANTVYLVTQVGVADLRNANRFISRYFYGTDGDRLEIVLNRYLARNLEIDESAVTKALTRPAKWKIPNDYAAARRAQNTGVPLALEKSPVARVLTDMANAAAGQTPAQEKKKKFGLFG